MAPTHLRAGIVVLCFMAFLLMSFDIRILKELARFPQTPIDTTLNENSNNIVNSPTAAPTAAPQQQPSYSIDISMKNITIVESGAIEGSKEQPKVEMNEELRLMLNLTGYFKDRPGIFKYLDESYDEVMQVQNSDYYHYKHRKQFPQVSFADVNSSKDVILMFEEKRQFLLFWGEPDFSKAVTSFQYRQIPCDHYGVKTCTITYEREYLERADAIVQVAPFNEDKEPKVKISANQTFIGFYTEADDVGCQKKMFDVRLSYSPDANIKYNDNCITVRLMYQCMSKIIRVLSRKNGLTQREINRWKRKMYQYCVTHSSASEDELESNVMSYDRKETGDVAMFVSNCAIPRSYYIKSLVEASKKSKTLKVNSYGKCYKNIKSDDNKITAGYKHKFLFAMENKLKMDYVTEKIFQAYQTGAVPIYRGSPNIFDYAPNGSFIGLYIFAKPQELIDHISYLLKNESAYDEYFNWDFDEWLKKPHTIQCLQIEAEALLDAGWCSVCDWIVNIAPKWKQKGLNNCDKSEYAPYFGYPRNPLKYKAKYN